MRSSPDLTDYLAFFEAEPNLITPGTEWYDGVRFEAARDGERIIAEIAPNEGEFSFKWWRGEALHFDVFLAGVTQWLFETKDNAERLVLKFEQPELPYFILQLRPHISVVWRASWS